ncbi:glycosyltransferase [Lignipirellula cremea]|uniref:Hyaluronan synthase n=1 Tax=Lignipirellula cremea TaxID=2528010 RepID=A0A518DS09_9BACT|nr:glycosyltransferase [Lignipirellula cremea]QDU94630.1 Hyaluronan synthase [Lignipirellula cremea]
MLNKLSLSLANAVRLFRRHGPFFVLRQVTDLAGKQGLRQLWARTRRYLSQTPYAQSQAMFDETPVPVEERLATGPKISILMPTYKTRPDDLSRVMQSVMQQTYALWEMCIVDDGSADPILAESLNGYAAADERIRVQLAPQNQGISGASNLALAMASGEYLALLDHDDELSVNALHFMAKAILDSPDADFFYSDECIAFSDSQSLQFTYKPDWCPETLINGMYPGHLSVYKTSLVEAAGGFRSEFDFSQDYDLALRATEMATKVVHLPRVLYKWRAVPESAAGGGKSYARTTNMGALADAARRRQWDAQVVDVPAGNCLQFRPQEQLVSLVVVAQSASSLQAFLKAFGEGTDYPHWEIVVVAAPEIRDAMPAALRPLATWTSSDMPHNNSAARNAGAAAAQGELLVFLECDIRPGGPDWLTRLVEYFQIDGVGAVSPRVLYANGFVRSAGYCAGMRGFVGNPFHGWSPYDPETIWVRNVRFLTWECLAVRKQLFHEAGQWDDRHFARQQNAAADLSLRVQACGYRCVLTPYADVKTAAPMPRRAVDADGPRDPGATLRLICLWGKELAEDPCLPRNMLGSYDAGMLLDFHPPDQTAGGDPFAPSLLFVLPDLAPTGASGEVFPLAAAMRREGCSIVVVAAEKGEHLAAWLAAGIPVLIDASVHPEGGAGHASVHDFAADFDQVVVVSAGLWAFYEKLLAARSVHWWIHEDPTKRLSDQGRSTLFRAADLLVTWDVRQYSHTRSTEKNLAEILVRQGVQGNVHPLMQDASLQEEETVIDRACGEPMRLLVDGADGRPEDVEFLISALSQLPAGMRPRLGITFLAAEEPASRTAELQQAFLPLTGLGLDILVRPTGTSVMNSTAEGEDVSEPHKAVDYLLLLASGEEALRLGPEAWQWGKPLLVEQQAAFLLAVEPGVNGLLFDRQTPGSLTQRLEELAGQRMQYPQRAAAARETWRRQRRILDAVDRLQRRLGMETPSGQAQRAGQAQPSGDARSSTTSS